MTEQERVADLCERLEYKAGKLERSRIDPSVIIEHAVDWNPDGPEAAAELKRLAARCDALEKGLREIEADCEADYPPSHGAIKYCVRAALGSDPA